MKNRTKITLPDGVKIAPKPELLEVYMKGRGNGDRWVPYVLALKALTPQESLQFDLSKVDDVKKHARATIVGIRMTARKMGVEKRIRYALISSILHVTF